MGRLIGTDESSPVAMNYPAHPITERFNVMTAYPLARGVIPGCSREGLRDTPFGTTATPAYRRDYTF